MRCWSLLLLLGGCAAPNPWPVPSSPYRGRQGDGDWLRAVGLSSYGGYDAALPSCAPTQYPTPTHTDTTETAKEGNEVDAACEELGLDLDSLTNEDLDGIAEQHGILLPTALEGDDAHDRLHEDPVSERIQRSGISKPLDEAILDLKTQKSGETFVGFM